MTLLYLVLLILVIVIALSARLSLAYAARLTEKMATESLRDMDTIVNGQAVPRHWVRAVERRTFGSGLLARLDRVKYGQPADAESQAKARLLLRLDKFARYMERCPFLDDPEARRVILTELQSARTTWQAQSWTDLVRAAS
jgi:hypothetical protein